MRLQRLPIEQAIGHILCHNLADEQGRKALAKGHRLQAGDLERLRAIVPGSVRVAVLDPDDVHEDEAAARLAALLAGGGVRPTPAHAGRANLIVAGQEPAGGAYAGVLEVDAAALMQINNLDGLTAATLPSRSLVRPDQIVATIKVIPFAVPGTHLEAAAATAPQGGIVRVRPFLLRRVGVVLVSSVAARRRIARGVFPAIEGRIQELGGELLAVRYVEIDEAMVAEAVAGVAGEGAELIIVAGETSIIDIDDVTPEGIRRAGGRIEHYGAPVEPGNLLLLAYLERAGIALPVLGAPGCVRSRSTNIVDLLLPRLMAGEQIRRGDIVALGHGGLLGV